MKIKKTLYGLSLITIVVLIFFGIKIYKKQVYKDSISSLSSIELSNYALNAKFYNSGSINCLMIFHTDCSFCLDEIEDIVDNIEDFENVNFYLVSNQSFEELNEYSNDSEFLELQNFTIIHDKDQKLFKFFNFPVSPSTFIYSKEGNLLNYRNGFVPNHTLKEMITKN
jgi:thioredoxin-related protein